MPGDLGNVALQMPVDAVVGRPVGKGYWMAALDGGVFGYGGARSTDQPPPRG